MTQKQYQRRQARIAAGKCPRCNRPVDPWPLVRADVCSPASWVYCIRHWRDIRRAETQLTVK